MNEMEWIGKCFTFDKIFRIISFFIFEIQLPKNDFTVAIG